MRYNSVIILTLLGSFGLLSSASASNIQNNEQPVLEVKLETGQILELTANDQVFAQICYKVKSGYSEFSEWVGGSQGPPAGPALGGKLVIEDSMYGMGTQEAYEYLTETCNTMNVSSR